MTHDTPPTRAQGENPWPIWDIGGGGDGDGDACADGVTVVAGR